MECHLIMRVTFYTLGFKYPFHKHVHIYKVYQQKYNPSTPEQIRTVTSFIRQSLELREGDSSVIIAVHVSVFLMQSCMPYLSCLYMYIM